jgi:uncharacterized Zn finger protein
MKCPVCGSEQGYMAGVLTEKIGQTRKQVWECNDCEVVSILRVPQVSSRVPDDVKKPT